MRTSRFELMHKQPSKPCSANSQRRGTGILPVLLQVKGSYRICDRVGSSLDHPFGPTRRRPIGYGKATVPSRSPVSIEQGSPVDENDNGSSCPFRAMDAMSMFRGFEVVVCKKTQCSGFRFSRSRR